MIIALHGFLGLPQDWSALEGELRPDSGGASKLWAPSLWNDLRLLSSRLRTVQDTELVSLYSLQTTLGFDLWAENFIRQIERKFASSTSGSLSRDPGVKTPTAAGKSETSASPKPILLGYSLGGRLAMHVAALRPDLFRGAIFVSANPGLSSALPPSSPQLPASVESPNSTSMAPSPNSAELRARDERFRADQVWAQKFLRQEWSSLVREWNEQPVFRTVAEDSREGQAVAPSARPPLDRRERDFDRVLLAEALTVWSLARQRDLRPALTQAAATCPVLLITGEQDEKFTDLTRVWCGSPLSHRSVAGAGHRVPWDQPGAFARLVREWAAGLDGSSR